MMEWSKSDIVARYKLVIFDLDDTLYREADFLEGAYRRVGERCGIAEAGSWLMAEFRAHGRQRLLDRFKQQFGVALPMKELLEALHSFNGSLQLDRKAETWISYLLECGVRVYILTNGNLQQQQNKVAALGIEERFPEVKVVYAAQYEPKPSPLAVEKIVEVESMEKSETVMIGDASTDEETARRAGVDFVYVQHIV